MHMLMVGTTAPSHIYPSLALIRELVARGHRVEYLVGDRLADLVSPTGATVITHPSILPDSDEHWPEDGGVAMQIFLDEQISVLPTIEGLDRPDAVLYDIGGFAGRVAAERWETPAIQLSPTYVAWDGIEQDLAEQTATLKASASGRHYFATLRHWLDENGIDIDGEVFVGRPESCVVLVPRALQPRADRVGPHCVFAGPCIDLDRTRGWSPSPGDARPLVYVCLGTSYTDRPDLYRLCLSELADTCRLVLATGKVDPADLGPLPAGALAARTQPQLDILAHASVFITHAGMGGASESLWFGVPTVAVPQAVDQFLNAATLAELGTGVHLPDGELDGPRLRAAVTEALGNLGRARELREEVRRSGGTSIAADAVERLANQAKEFSAERRHLPRPE
jgi:MGT family glycosyltransferase